MMRTWGPVLGALIAIAAPGAAAAQVDDAAELAEAHAIVGIMFPPAQRDETMRTLIEQVAGQLRQAFPADFAKIGDPGLTAMMTQFRASLLEAMMPTVQAHMPRMFEATAIAYTHEFDLGELREIHAFAETPAGRHYLSRSAALIGDPAVAEANTAYFRDIQDLVATEQAEFTEQLTAYFTKHPDVARKVTEATGAQ